MEEIKHTYTIQWVGPLSYKDYKNYLMSEETINPGLFSIYYFEARIDGRYKKRRYLGIHKKNDGIYKRLNKSHEHFSQFIDAKELSISQKSPKTFAIFENYVYLCNVDSRQPLNFKLSGLFL